VTDMGDVMYIERPYLLFTQIVVYTFVATFILFDTLNLWSK
jgi:hypothetical protein